MNNSPKIGLTIVDYTTLLPFDIEYILIYTCIYKGLNIDNCIGVTTNKIMRYNIKRLYNEVITHEHALKMLLSGNHAISKVFTEKQIDFEINSKRHAISLCHRLIGEEVVIRWKEGRNLNQEIETEPIFLLKEII